MLTFIRMIQICPFIFLIRRRAFCTHHTDQGTNLPISRNFNVQEANQHNEPNFFISPNQYSQHKFSVTFFSQKISNKLLSSWGIAGEGTFAKHPLRPIAIFSLITIFSYITNILELMSLLPKRVLCGANQFIKLRLLAFC